MIRRSLETGACDFVADPNLRADRASVVWLPALHPATVIVVPAPAEFGHARSIAALTPVFVRRTVDGEHWLLADGCDALPAALIAGADGTGAAALIIPLDGSFTVRVEAAVRLEEAMTGGGPVRAPDALTVQQRARLALILRSIDGRLSGASYRDVARALFGADRIPTAAEWKNHDLRGRVIRLCRRGSYLMNGGYLELLRNSRRLRG